MKTKLHTLSFPSNKVSRTFFHSALMAAVVLLLALGDAISLTPSSSSARQNSQNRGGQQSNRISDQYIVNGLPPGSSLMEVSAQEVWYDNDGMDCYPFWSKYMDQGDAQVKNGVELVNVSFSNPNPPIVPVGGIVIVTAPVTAAAANNGATSCRVCIETTEASASLNPNYPDGSRCSAADSINAGNTKEFTVRLRVESAGPPLPMTFKAKGMVEVTNPNIAEVRGTNPKVTTNTATVQAP